MLNTEILRNGRELTIGLEGRLDTLTAPELESTLKEQLPETDSLVLDLGGLTYISSAGLRVLLSAQKIMAKADGMVVRNASAEVMEIFEVTGFSDILTIE